MTIQKITPFLWYSKEAEEAAAFCASIFPDSRITRAATMPSESPSGPPGSVKVVEFVLFGQTFVAMSAGPLDPFNHAVSFVVNCETQAELDRYWNAPTHPISVHPEDNRPTGRPIGIPWIGAVARSTGPLTRSARVILTPVRGNPG
jgi:predicted 3-demethylubiquinone-9 3-methyltransferase (glyoxalase superfamily)